MLDKFIELETALNIGKGSPIGFSGSGIWLIKRPGFGIWGERGARFGIVDINETRDLGIICKARFGKWRFKEPRYGKLGDKMYKKKIKLSSS